MGQDSNRIIYLDGHMWVNYRTDGRGPETRHLKLEKAIQRAHRCIEKSGGGKLKIRDAHGDTLIYAIVKNNINNF